MVLLDVQHIQKVYTTRFGMNKIEALKDIHFSVDEGEYVAIMGESGSGKTTLLNILATLDRPTKGTIHLNGIDIASIPNKNLSAFRRDKLGFVFQEFNLLDTLSVKDNIILPLILSRVDVNQVDKKVETLTHHLGIHELLYKFPYELSGGQQQRTAIARALITQPSILLADEPTGALDSKSSSTILDLFDQVNANGQTILMVTHSITAASRAKRVIFIKDGILYNQLLKGTKSDAQMFQQISDTLTIMASRGE